MERQSQRTSSGIKEEPKCFEGVFDNNFIFSDHNEIYFLFSVSSKKCGDLSRFIFIKEKLGRKVKFFFWSCTQVTLIREKTPWISIKRLDYFVAKSPPWSGFPSSVPRRKNRSPGASQSKDGWKNSLLCGSDRLRMINIFSPSVPRVFLVFFCFFPF